MIGTTHGNIVWRPNQTNGCELIQPVVVSCCGTATRGTRAGSGRIGQPYRHFCPDRLDAARIVQEPLPAGETPGRRIAAFVQQHPELRLDVEGGIDQQPRKLVIPLDQIADQPLSIVGNSGVGTEFRSASASCQRRRGQRSHADLNVCTDTGVQSDRSTQIEDPCNQGRVRTRFPKLTH